MKYLIQDTEDHTLGEINKYFKRELMKTSLNKEDIIIEDKLKIKIGMTELERILDNNGMSIFYELGLGYIHLRHTSHNIRISRDEIQLRFENAYVRVLNECKES